MLEALGIAPDQIRTISYDLRITSNSEGQTLLQGVNAWVTLEGQPVYLVVTMTPSCRLTTWSTRAGVRLPNEA